MRRTVAALAVLAAFALATPAMAQDTHWKIFGGLSYFAPMGDSDWSGLTEAVEASDEVGYEFGVEYRFGKRVGLEFSYVDVSSDIESGDTLIGESGIQPANLALNFYLIPGDVFSLYVAPVASYVMFDDLELDGGLGSEEVDSEFAYGAQLGIDIGFGKNFAVIGGVRWLSLDATSDDPAVPDDEELAIDPLFARLGVAFRF